MCYRYKKDGKEILELQIYKPRKIQKILITCAKTKLKFFSAICFRICIYKGGSWRYQVVELIARFTDGGEESKRYYAWRKNKIS